MSNFRDVTEK